MADRLGTLSIDGFELDAETIRDSFEKAIAVYEYPYIDGADTEDLGHRARRISIRCYFLGENYARHEEFLAHLDSRELFELNHSKYGLLQGRIDTVSVSHDDRLETAEIDLAFVVNRKESSAPAKYADVQGAAEEIFVGGQTSLIANYADDVRAELGPEASAILAATLAPELGIAEQFPNVSRAARRYLQTVDGWVGDLTGTLVDVTNPANSLTSIISYPDTMAGRVIGSLARTVERWAVSLGSLRSAPTRYLDSLQTGLGGLTTSAGVRKASFAKPARIAASQRLAVEASSLYAADELNRQARRQAEKKQIKNFDALGNYLSPDQSPEVMTTNDLERSLAIVRGDMQEAIDATRDTGNSSNMQVINELKSMSRSLTDHVDEIKLERDRMVTVRLDNPMPLHLVCLRYGLSYQYAARLQAVNNISSPNFTSGEIVVYAG